MVETISPVISTTVPTAEPVDKVPCVICRRQFSKYTCPTCNITYCSLTCFRSEAHAQCSETFYRKEVESDIRSEPSKTAEERLRMMELLKRFEQESAEDESAILAGDEGDDEDESNDLARRLANVDMASTSPDALWSMLTPAERDKFLKALDDPSSELAQQLLASEELEHDRQEPWWDSPSLDDKESSTGKPKQYGAKPTVMEVPSTMIKPSLPGSPLLYNMCAICIAYAYTTRHLSYSPLSAIPSDDSDSAEARNIMMRLVPFLTDRKSKTLYPNLSSAVTDIWSRFDSGKMTGSSFSVLLRDTAHLIRPLPVTLLSPDLAKHAQQSHPSDAFPLDAHPSLTVVLALSDLATLFQRPPGDAGTSHNHVTHKLIFYAAQVLSTPSLMLSGLADEVATRSEIVQADDISSVAMNTMEDRRSQVSPESITKPRVGIQEIS